MTAAQLEQHLALAMHRETQAILATVAYLEGDPEQGEAHESHLDALAVAHEAASRRVRHLLCVCDHVAQAARDARPSVPAEAIIEAAKRLRP